MLNISQGWIFGGAMFTIALFLVLPLLVMWIWNTTLIELFKLPNIRYSQAFKILLLAFILMGGPGNLVTTTRSVTQNSESSTENSKSGQSSTKTITFGLP